MNTPRLRRPFAALLSVFCLLGQTSIFAVTIPVEDDAIVNEASSATNYGTRVVNDVWGTASSNRWVYIQFGDITADLPAGTTKDHVSRAVLYLYVSDVLAGGSGSMNGFAVSGSWAEGTLTFGSKPSNDLTAIAGSPFSIGTADKGEYIGIPITALVKEWIDPITSGNNHGIVFKANGTSLKVEFDSKEATGTSHAPFLEVTLDSVGGNSILSAISGGTWTGANTINTLGTITAGTWNGTAISLANGGTGSSNGSITGTGALTFASGGTNTGITLTPTGTGMVVLSSDALINGLRFGRGGGGMASNVAAGNAALSANTTGYYNVGVGNAALTLNTTGLKNIAVGSAALAANTNGHYNVAVGNAALASNTSGQWNIAIGDEALLSATTANSNVAIGGWALRQTTTVGGLTAVGTDALSSNTSGGYNTALGSKALGFNTTGDSNTALGTSAIASNTTGGSNIGIGRNSLYSNTTGGNNIAIGTGALTDNVESGGSIAIGDLALRFANAPVNIALGFSAGSRQADGTTPLALTNSLGSLGNIYIGREVRGFDNNDANSIVIGSQAIGEGANKTVIGNVNTNQTHTFGSLLIGGGATAPELRLLEASGNGSNYTGFTSPPLATNLVYTLPATDGTNGQVLTTNGSNVLSWSTPAGGGGGGTVTSVSVATANGISGTSSGGATPQLTLSLGVINPTSVNGLTLLAQGTGFSIIGGGISKTLTVGEDAEVSGNNTGDQDLTGFVLKTTTVNGHALSDNVTVTASDVDLAALTEDTSPDPSVDFVVTYDASAASNKKVKPRNLTALGVGSVSNGPGQTVVGTHNDRRDNDDTTTPTPTDHTLGTFVVGAGTPGTPLNALRVLPDGTVLVKESGGVSMGPYKSGPTP